MLKNTIRIIPLGIEVTKPIEWTKTVGEIKVPKGWKIIEKWQLWFILDGSKYMDEFLGDFKGKWNLFYCAPSNYMKLNKLAGLSGLYPDGDLDLNSYWSADVLASSDGNGRVCFVRSLR